jgi:hypothetical protein
VRHDYDRARCVLGEVLADRAEQEPPELAEPTRADDDEVGASGSLDQSLRRVRLDHLTPYFHVRLFPQLLAEHLLQELLGLLARSLRQPVEVVGADRRVPGYGLLGEGQAQRDAPDVHGMEGGAPQARLLVRELECCAGAGRSVQPDDNASSRSVACCHVLQSSICSTLRHP